MNAGENDIFTPPARPLCEVCRGSGNGHWDGQGWDDCEACLGSRFKDGIRADTFVINEYRRILPLARKVISEQAAEIKRLNSLLGAHQEAASGLPYKLALANQEAKP